MVWKQAVRERDSGTWDWISGVPGDAVKYCGNELGVLQSHGSHSGEE
jgi:hypothetical protein